MALRTAAIQMIWPGDEGSFYRKLVDTVAANPGFAGVGSAALFQPAHGPARSTALAGEVLGVVVG